MRIYIHELSDEPRDLHFSANDAWVKKVVEDSQESAPAQTPTYKVDFSLYKSQDLVFLKGAYDLELGAFCSRCAKPISIHMKSNYESLFTREKQLEDDGHHTHGVAYSAPTGQTGEEMEIEYLEKDYIELEEVLKEQIYLGLPIQPLCKEDCKGICAVCGQDQNVEPCQCHRIKNTAMAKALKGVIRGNIPRK